MTDKTHMDSRILAEKIDQAWEVSWRMFFVEKTGLFYDFITGRGEADRLQYLPLPQEIAACDPNPCGWGTGMEDSAIHAGVMMAMTCDRFEATGESFLADYAAKILKGMVNCSSVHGVKGFVARSVCPEDGKSVYPETSLDQYTHFVHGLWRYFHSGLTDESSSETCRKLISSVCKYIETCAVPENDYLIRCADGKFGSPVSCKLWHAKPHAAARLPMFYAACWDMTGDRHWLKQYKKYADKAVQQSTQVGIGLSLGTQDFYPAYALMQMQCSLELLSQMEENNDDFCRTCRQAMNQAAELAEFNAWHVRYEDAALDATGLCGDWRTFEKIKGSSHAVPNAPEIWRDAFWRVRESGEAALAQLMVPKRRMSNLQLNLLKLAITRHDYNKISNSGLFYLQAAYWKAVKLGYLKRA
jgi:hypothetical protein